MNDWAQIRAAAALYEDDAALVLNKPAGLSVMGERHDTDLVRLAEEAGEKLYPAHRIDKVTSGVLLLAKDLARHGDLTRQFNRRTVDKVYLAITATTGLPDRGTIELPLSVGRKNRVRVAANRAAIAFDPARSCWSVPPEEQFQEVRTYPSTSRFLTVGRRRGAHAARRLPGDRAPAPDPGAPGLDRPSHRGRSAVRQGGRGPDAAALVAAGVRRGLGRRPAHPGRGAPGTGLLGSPARWRGPAARLGRHRARSDPARPGRPAPGQAGGGPRKMQKGCPAGSA